MFNISLAMCQARLWIRICRRILYRLGSRHLTKFRLAVCRLDQGLQVIFFSIHYEPVSCHSGKAPWCGGEKYLIFIVHSY